jgi:hypothetical protein
LKGKRTKTQYTIHYIYRNSFVVAVLVVLISLSGEPEAYHCLEHVVVQAKRKTGFISEELRGEETKKKTFFFCLNNFFVGRVCLTSDESKSIPTIRQFFSQRLYSRIL